MTEVLVAVAEVVDQTESDNYQWKQTLYDGAKLYLNTIIKISVHMNYCVFHAIRSVLALDRFDSKKHSGVIAKFTENYIKTGILPDEVSDAIKETFEVRQDSDYGDMYEVTEEETAMQIQHAEYVYETMGKYLKERWNTNTTDGEMS